MFQAHTDEGEFLQNMNAISNIGSFSFAINLGRYCLESANQCSNWSATTNIHNHIYLTIYLYQILYANNMFPLLVKPTRVTDKSATLIDHIMTNNFMFIQDISKVT